MEGGTAQGAAPRRSRAEVQLAVREALVELLRESSFKDITVDELARAGIADVYLQHADILRAAVEATTYDEEFKDFYTALIQRFVTATADHLRRELAAGTLRQLDPDAVAE